MDREKKDKVIPYIVYLNEVKARHLLSRILKWEKETQKASYVTIPPKPVVQDFLETPNMDLPLLRGIVETPSFTEDGALETMKGYSPKTKLYYAPPADFSMPSVSDNPSRREIQKAKNLILRELLGDMPFVGVSEKAHAIALLFLPFVRDMIDGPTPLHLVEKSTPGTGATLLIRAIAHVCIGREYTLLPEAGNGEEWRKRITAVLRTSPVMINIDNLKKPLDSAALASALTATEWSDRILGKSEYKSIPIRATWIATGNNPVLSEEMTRRSVRIRLDAKVEYPHLRPTSDFKHPELLVWTKDNRGVFVWACCTLIQAWISAGKPSGTQTIGMYENWAKVIGGILDVINVPGLLGNLDQFYEGANIEKENTKLFIAKWYKEFKTSRVRVKDLLSIATLDEVEFGLSEGKGSQSQSTVLGIKLTTMKNQVFMIKQKNGCQLRVVVRKSDQFIEHSTAWFLETGLLKKEVKGLKRKKRKFRLKKEKVKKPLKLRKQQEGPGRKPRKTRR